MEQKKILDELSKMGDTIIINSKTVEVLTEAIIEELKSKGTKILVNDFVPVGSFYGVKKSDEKPEELYGELKPYIAAPTPLFMNREPEVKLKSKIKASKSNINDITNTDDGTIIFTLSFYKKKDCHEVYEFSDKSGIKHTITIDMSKPYTDSFKFTYYDLEVKHQKGSEKTETISKIKIHDSYKKWCDCVGYTHGIYRDKKDSCYKVITVLHENYLWGEEITLI